MLEEQFAETAETQPELLAHHHTEAGLLEQAVDYWHKAGQIAVQRSAHMEAIAHFRQGLALLQTLPASLQRTQHELLLHITLGGSLIAVKGYGATEVGETYTSARQLCQSLEAPHQLFSALRGLCGYYNVRAEYQMAHALGEQLLTLGQQLQDSAMLMAAHRALGTTLFAMGRLDAAHLHLAQGIALYDRQPQRASAFLYGENTGVVCGSHDTWVLWHLGFPDQGLTRSRETVSLAHQLAHPFSLVHALSAAARFHQLRREERCTQHCVETVLSLAQEQGFAQWIAFGACYHGWALAQQGDGKAGIEQITQGLRAYRATGAESGRSAFLALLAETYGIMGQPEAGLTVLTEALTLADTTGTGWCEAELYRLKGALLLQLSSDNQAKAEACYQHALDIARNQQAKSLELRATTSLARLWQQ